MDGTSGRLTLFDSLSLPPPPPPQRDGPEDLHKGTSGRICCTSHHWQLELAVHRSWSVQRAALG